MERAESAASTLTTALAGQSGNPAPPRLAGQVAAEAQYLIPLAFRKRALFKMDFAEAVYIAELRTAPAGHRSYRNIAWQMYAAVAKRHPSLARFFRVHDVRQPVDLLQR
jgi:thymidylate synthase ThyX